MNLLRRPFSLMSRSSCSAPFSNSSRISRSAKYLILGIGFLLLAGVGVAQTVPATVDSLQKVYSRQALFGKIYSQERVYLHLDKPYYQLGDMLYYKIYATTGNGLLPDTLSKTLYVELLDASGTVLQSQKKFLSNGLGLGSMEISGKYAPGVYRVRAFTSWMRNFTTEPLFEKVITIYGEAEKGLKWHLTSMLSEGPKLDTLRVALHLTDSLYRGVASPYDFTFTGKGIRMKGSLSTANDGSGQMSLLLPKDRKEGLGMLSLTVGDDTQEKDIVLASKGLRVLFFPEGGQWVAGVSSRVGYKVTDENGSGVSFRGLIRNSRGEVVVRFESQHRGMGAFRMTPQAGETYTAEVTSTVISAQGLASPRTQKDALPMVQPHGYVMEVDGVAADTIHVRIDRGGMQRDELLGIMIQNGGQILWRGHLRMRSDSSVLRFAKASLPTGMSQITLYRADGSPVSERLVFVNNGDALRVQISSPKQAYSPREKINLNLQVTDPRGNPVRGSFSLSVTDKAQVKDTSRYGENILTHLLLASEVRGLIEDPGYYFDADTKEKRQALEYLLLTQGWRKYLWNLAMADSLPKLEYPVERGIPVSGTIRNITTGKPVADHEVTLMLQHKEGIDVSTYTTDATGRFKFLTDYFGEAKVNIQTKKKDKNIERAIDLDDNEFTFNEVAKTTGDYSDGQPGKAGDLSQTLSQTQAALEDYQQAQEAIRAFQAKSDSLMKTINLKEVEVMAKWSQKVEITRQKDTTLLVRQTLESIRNDVNFGISSISQFLIHAYPELFEEDCSGENCVVAHRGKRPLLYLVNGWKVDSGRLDGENINCYNKVEIIEKRGAAVAFGGDIDDIVIALTLNPDAVCYEQSIGVRSYRMQGYAQEKEFYSPDYEKANLPIPDARATLLWVPHVQTDAAGKATVSFFNSDEATGIHVNVQGIATMGSVGAGANTLEIGRTRN